jgi:Uma2 family endonuclease
MAIKTQASIEDLYRVPENGKAELVNGELLLMQATGAWPSLVAAEIYVSLRAYARQTRSGIAFTDNTAFIVNLPNRRSFSPDAAFFTGPITGMKFLDGAPIFAVEVRSENDYEPKAERDMVAKRADYFAAGTQVVWDVDLLSENVVRKYATAQPDTAVYYRRGEIADAEPALPGWTMPVDDLFQSIPEDSIP